MANTSAIILMLVSFFFCLLIGIHVYVAILISAFSTAMFAGVDLRSMCLHIVRGLNVYSLMAVPLFIYAGEIMSCGGITARLVRLSQALVGWIRGSLAQVNIVASLFFGSISGSSAADTASIGAMMIPMMEKEGYDTDFSTCVTMASSVEGMLIPPSHNMVLFALAAGNVSIARLFMAGVVPGLVLALCLGIYCYAVARSRNYPKGAGFQMREFLSAFLNALPGLGTVLIVVVGVLAGIFTATEAAGFAVVYSLFVGIFFYKEIKIKDIPRISLNALKTISIVMILVAASNCFSFLTAYLNVASAITNFIMSVTSNKILILLMINVFLLVCGMFMDMAATILIVTPILMPIIMQLGMDPAQFCCLVIINLGMGLITPPVGNTLFIGSAISGHTIGRLSKAMLPFYGMMFVALMIITFVPAVSTWLPNLLGS